MKRANGTGTVAYLGPGRRNPYVARVSVPDPRRDGMKRQVAVGYYATVAEAQAALDEMNARAGSAPPDTFGGVWETYQASRKYKGLSDSAKSVYAMAWSRLSALADRPVAGIRRTDVQKVIDDAESEGLSPASISKIQVLAGMLFDIAIQDDLINKNPARFVELPQNKAVYEKNIIPEEVLQALWKDRTESGDTVLLLCYTGWRISEFCALTPESYTTEPPMLCGGMKTEAGKNRHVPVIPSIQPIVERRFAKLGRLSPQKSVAGQRAAFCRVMQGFGLDGATPHWARYTFTSMCRMAGIDTLVVDRVTGHSSRGMTDHYTKYTDEYLYQEIVRIDPGVINAPAPQENAQHLVV